MAESPSTRQQSPLDTRQTTENTVEETNMDTTRPTTPKRRASYLSPTKASLARSHPNILAKSPKRGSLTEPRGKLLRQELLGSRKSMSGTDPTLKSTSEVFSQESRVQTRAEAPTEPDRDGFADAIAQSFQSATADRSEEFENRTAVRSPLLTRQPPNTVPNKRRREEKDDSPIMTSFPVPTLVRRPEAPSRQKSEARNEPDLPPTPVQLGIGIAPDRPRGLASSSSVGSKSGSGRHRKRIRSGGSAITSSPLKPKNTRPLSPIDFSDVENMEVEAVAEAPESDVEEGEDQPQQEVEEAAETDSHNVLPEGLSQKQKEGASLRSELEKLRKDLASIESLAQRLQQGGELDIGENEIELLNSSSHKAEASLPSLDTHLLYTKNASAYLDLFAPGNLQLKHETSPAQIEKRLKVDHRLTLSAPRPWPQNLLQHTFSIRVDAEDSRIEEIIQTDLSLSNEHNSLQRWVKSRLQDPLHRLNATGLVWGIGQYFQACVRRARFFRSVDEAYNQSTPPPRLDARSAAVLDKIYLSRYFHETHITVAHVDAKTESAPRKIRVDYHVDLTWTGDTTVRVDIALAGVNAKAETAAKELFVKLLGTEDVLPAFEHVCETLGIKAPGSRSTVDR